MNPNVVSEPHASPGRPVISGRHLRGLASSRKSWLLVTLIVVAIAIVAVLLLVSSHRARTIASRDDRQIRFLTERQACSGTSTASVSGLRPSTSAPAASLDLYTYRANCLSLSHNYRAAAAELAEERQFALRIHDPADAADAAEEYANVKTTLAQSSAKGSTR
jgi:hypothetical protein